MECPIRIVNTLNHLCNEHQPLTTQYDNSTAQESFNVTIRIRQVRPLKSDRYIGVSQATIKHLQLSGNSKMIGACKIEERFDSILLRYRTRPIRPRNSCKDGYNHSPAGPENFCKNRF